MTNCQQLQMCCSVHTQKSILTTYRVEREPQKFNRSNSSKNRDLAASGQRFNCNVIYCRCLATLTLCRNITRTHTIGHQLTRWLHFQTVCVHKLNIIYLKPSLIRVIPVSLNQATIVCRQDAFHQKTCAIAQVGTATTCNQFLMQKNIKFKNSII